MILCQVTFVELRVSHRLMSDELLYNRWTFSRVLYTALCGFVEALTVGVWSQKLGSVKGVLSGVKYHWTRVRPNCISWIIFSRLHCVYFLSTHGTKDIRF